jgi:DNA invertase Pin-like site-specific DNA recombinase
VNAPVRARRGETALGGGTAARVVVKRRCAVYTRKSSEEGLDMEFNSLDAQREACEAYVQSQKAEGWVLVPDFYDDGGISGGTLERPALKRLLADIEAGRVDVVVVYKIDRLSRSLMDFARLVDVFDRNEVTFVSITQSFNTTTSMGRLTLNILLSFAQFEREVIGERIRDKFAASRKKGMWMGGWAPLGYRVENRRLIIDQVEAEKVRWIFTRYVQTGSVTMVVKELTAEGFVSRYGQSLDKGRLYKLLNNRVYLGEAVHKGTAYPGEHEAIVSPSLWDRVHSVMAEGARAKAGRSRAQTPALLKGIIYDAEGRAMSPSHTRKGQRLYRYYVSQSVIRGVGRVGTTLSSTYESGASDHPSGTDATPSDLVTRVPAGDVEAAVMDQLRLMLRSPEIIVATWRAARRDLPDLTEAEVRDALDRFDPLWDELFPAEQARIVRLLVERVDVAATGINIRLRVDGLATLFAEMRGAQPVEPDRGDGSDGQIEERAA